MADNNNEVINLGQKTGNTPENMKIHVEKDDDVSIDPRIIAQMTQNDFPIPIYEVNLPSQGLFYPDKQSVAKVKQLTAADENILFSKELIIKQTVLNVLLENNLTEWTVPVPNMLVGDKNACLIKIRIEGFGDEYDVKKTCMDCGDEFTQTVLLSLLKNKPIVEKPDAQGYFTFVLPKSKHKVRFRNLTVKDESYLSQMANQPSKVKTAVPQLITEQYVLLVMEVDGITDKGMIKKAMSNMPAGDSVALRNHMSSVAPGVDMSYNFTCTNCGHQFVDDVPIQSQFLWPNSTL